ncbi:MAG: elongation factor Ts [Gammaproteobacteria bacterium]|nr:elongation factor Ts [Gammaproteobacteria bacterium]
MSNITAAQVKELRERTGSGMMECKKALVEAQGDMESAIAAMRKAGQAKATKKAGRVAAEGVVAIKVAADNEYAFMVEINTETDFAARDASFLAFVEQVVTCGLEQQAVDVPALLAMPIKRGSSIAVAQAHEALVAKIGENIQIRRVALLKQSEGLVGAYCHSNRIGVLVALEGAGDLALGKDIAMHIAASKPEVVAPEFLAAAVIDKEKEIYLAQAATSGKPAEILEKMVAGRIQKFINEISLVGQPFVKDSSITVGELLAQQKNKVVDFIRFEVGEGIEKEITDFATEVQAQVSGK